jgi:adenine specific DNA methylase Mod
MYERRLIMHELLARKGTIYLHCNSIRGAQLKIILEEIFGAESFINEITWHYYNKMAPDSKCFPRASDKILCYTKSFGEHTFFKQIERGTRQKNS